MDLIHQLEHDFPGLKLYMGYNATRKFATLDLIAVENQKKGIGTIVMNKIINWADKNHVTIALSPSDDFGFSIKKLTEFYKRFGFIENKGKNKDFSISNNMYRIPKEL